MLDFEVEIDERPLGVRFAHADKGETVVVHLVLEGKVGDRVGLLPGDILIAVNGMTLLGKPSTKALEIFRSQELPYKATFRRFDDEDLSTDEDDDEDLSHVGSVDEEYGSEIGYGGTTADFQREEANHLLTGLAMQSKQAAAKSVQLRDWSVDDVLEWLVNYGRALGDERKFMKYSALFRENNIDGKVLRQCDKYDLAKIGIEESDIPDLYVGISELNNIIAVTAESMKASSAMASASGGASGASAAGDESKSVMDEDDQWEAPFLPYMYEAPTITLSSKTIVKIETHRIVSPYKAKPYTLYEIEVIDGDNEWLLSKRYSEFHHLHEEMRKLKITTGGKAKFPTKGVMKKSTKLEVVQDRMKKLSAYLNWLLKNSEEARLSSALNDFLQPTRTFVVEE